MSPALLPSQRIFPPDWLGPLPADLFHPRPASPLELDLGCGKGRFLLARARKHPDRDFFGVDRMLRRIRKIDNRLRREGLANIRLLRAEGFYTVSYLLPPESVDVLWILFPDPWPKAKHESHRLFNARFLDATVRILRPGGRLEFATDHAPYFETVRDILLADARFSPVPAYVPPEDEQTDFEKFYIQNKPIGRIGVVCKKNERMAPDFPSRSRRELEGDVLHRREFPTKTSAEKTSQPDVFYADDSTPLVKKETT